MTKKLINRCLIVIPVIFILCTLLIIIIYTPKSYVNDHTRQIYSVVILNETTSVINDVEMSIVNMESNENVIVRTEKNILQRENRKITIGIDDEILLSFPTSTYNVNIKCVVQDQIADVAAGYFTSEWGGLKVIRLWNNADNILQYDYLRENRKSSLYRKILKRHYYNPDEESWFE